MENRSSSDGSDSKSGENERKMRKRKAQENKARKSPAPKEEPRDEFALFGEHVAIKLRNLQDPNLQCFVQHQIHNAIYNAEVKHLSHSRTVETSLPSTSNFYGRTVAPQQTYFEVPFAHASATAPLLYRASYSFNSTFNQQAMQMREIPIARPSQSCLPPLVPLLPNAPMVNRPFPPFVVISDASRPQPQPDVLQVHPVPAVPAPPDSSRPQSPTPGNYNEPVSPILSVTTSD